MKLGSASLGALLVGMIMATAACAPGKSTTQGTGAGGNTGSGASTGTAQTGTAGTAQGGAGATSTSTGFMTTGSGCQTHCSADLHSVLDCNNMVVSMCPPDQGCGATGCVPACTSAQQNKSSIGCDYYSVDPDIIAEAQGGCLAAFVANTWDQPISIQLERAGVMKNGATYAYVPSGTGQGITYAPLPGGVLPVGQVAIVFLNQTGTFTPCPAGTQVAFAGVDAAVHGTGLGAAIHLTTSAPATVYDIYPYGGGQAAATSATLLLPTTVWDTNYIAVDAFRKSTIVAAAQPFIEIVAVDDGTTVTISPKAAIVGGAGVAPTAMGVPHTYNLNKGQILQFTQDAELNGSVVQSNNPIGMWGGESCLSVDVGQVACDSAHQEIPPVKALGYEYVAVRYRNRFPAPAPEENPPWRLVGAVAGTTLVYEPSAPAGAPTSLGVGQVAEFRAAGPFTVKSQDKDHPFYMSGHMTGCGETNPSHNDCRGDPEFVNVIPPQQYLSSYVFFTDPTYPETNLVIVREKGAAGFDDVTLDCLGTLTGWMPVGTSGQYQYTRTDLVTGNFQAQGNCNNGRHEMHSKSPFGLVVWGWGSAATGGCFGFNCGGFYSQAVSYAYPAGASVQPINTVVVPPNPM